MAESLGGLGHVLLTSTVRRRLAKGQGKVGPWGVLTLSPLHLHFQEGGTARGTELEVDLSDVVAHFVTPPAAKLACLKVIAEGGDEDAASGSSSSSSSSSVKRKAQHLEWVFEFPAGTARERDSFGELIAQLVPPLRRSKRSKQQQSQSRATSSVGEAERVRVKVKQERVVEEEEEEGGTATTMGEEEVRKREALLAGSDETRELYQRLVEGGVVSADEFWQGRERMLDAEARRTPGAKRRRIPAGSAEAGEVRPVAESGNSVQYKLTSADIRRIFSEQPAVHKAFEEWVPHRMTEVQFWTRYFRHKYFHRREDEGNESRHIASEPAAFKEEDDIQIQEKNGKERGKASAAGMDLDSDKTRNAAAGTSKGYGVAEGEDSNLVKATKKLSLFQKINRHATAALGEMEREGDMQGEISLSLSSLTSKASSPIKKTGPAALDPMESEARLADTTLLEELEEHLPNYVVLAIPDHRYYFRQGPEDTSLNAPTAASMEEMMAALSSEIEATRQSGAQLPLVDQRDASNAMDEIDGMLASFKAHREAGRGTHGLPITEMKMLSHYHERSMELLRHYWRCQPLTTRVLVERANKLAAAIGELLKEVEIAASKRKSKDAGWEILQSILRPLAKVGTTHPRQAKAK